MKKNVKNSVLIGGLVLSFALCGCGQKEAVDLETAQNTKDTAVAKAASINYADSKTVKAEKAVEKAEKKEDAKKDTAKKDTAKKDTAKKSPDLMKVTFDDGEFILNEDGIIVKDSEGEAFIQDGVIDIKDSDGNFVLNNDGIWIKDEATGKETMKFDKDGFYVEDEEGTVVWDKAGLKINSDDCNLDLKMSFPDFSNLADLVPDAEWNSTVDVMSDFFQKTLSDTITNSLSFTKNSDMKTWDNVTVLNSEETIDGQTIKRKIWFEDGVLKTKNIPEDNLTIENYKLVDTVTEGNDIIRIYQ